MQVRRTLAVTSTIGVVSETGGTPSNPGVTLPSDIQADVRVFMDQLAAQGWDFVVARGTRVRAWCTCPKRHQTWVETQPTADDYVEQAVLRLGRMTCFDPPEGGKE
jgi:hypothetical protein